MGISPAIKSKLDHLPGRPGVYLMRDRLGRVIYVGKAKALSKRVRSYFQGGSFSQMEPKIRALVGMVADIDTYEVKNEAEAILLEGKLIKEYRPKYNTAFRDDKRFLLVKLTRDPFPRFVLTRLQKSDGCRYFGPFSHSGALRHTLEYIRKNFHIRSCHPAEPGERDYKHCLNDIIKHCSAPCIKRITQGEYQRWVERACEFLEGRDEAALKEIEVAMMKAAEWKDYERAASLRDVLYDLRTTVKQSARKFVRDLPRAKNPQTELTVLAEVLEMERPPRVIEGFDISHIYGRHTVGSMVQFVDGRPAKTSYRHFNIKGQVKLGRDFREDAISSSEVSARNSVSSHSLLRNDDFASVREIVGRRYRRLKDEGKPLPDLVLIDGGRGQLNSALRALQEVGVKLKVIGLAKEEEEIYLPNHPRSIKLNRTSHALHLLQRVRDESHRFANTLHTNWRRKQIRESLLDELPGMGVRRKKALLQRFGSLARLREAGVKEISEMEGFGRKSAEILWRFLHPRS